MVAASAKSRSVALKDSGTSPGPRSSKEKINGCDGQLPVDV